VLQSGRIKEKTFERRRETGTPPRKNSALEGGTIASDRTKGRSHPRSGEGELEKDKKLKFEVNHTDTEPPSVTARSEEK